MSKKRTYALIVAVVGFVVLMVGSVGYMVNALSTTPSCILMGIGIVAVIGALLVISLTKEANEHAA